MSIVCGPVHSATADIQITKEEYASIGATRLGEALVKQLQSEGKNPYNIPVGGSSPLGCWGYVQAIQEIEEQSKELEQHFDVIASVSNTLQPGLDSTLRHLPI